MQSEFRAVRSADASSRTTNATRRLRTVDNREGVKRSTAPEQLAPTLASPVSIGDPSAENDLRLISLREAAQFLCVSRGKLYKLLHTGQLASVHIGRLRRIPLGELLRFVGGRVEREGGPDR